MPLVIGANEVAFFTHNLLIDHFGFYQQKGLIAKNLTLNWFPVGTGAYYLAENNPNRQMKLLANPNYHNETYPSLSDDERKKSNVPKELLEDSAKKLPFIKEIIYKHHSKKHLINLFNFPKNFRLKIFCSLIIISSSISSILS